MRRSALKQSELIQSIGWKDGNMEIKYRDDGAVFVYFAVPHSLYLRLKASNNPGQEWLRIRDKYTYREA
jgi:KTSC domain-containing protein